jgi:methyltransferase (TIGR00027 family)
MTTLITKPMPDLVKSQKHSVTADFTCLSRAMANREADPYFRGPDYIAEIFLSFRKKLIFGIPGVWKLYKRLRIPEGSYAYVFARTRFMDEVFVKVLGDDFAQIVLLGAGFDTRALRFQRQNNGTKIFELDRPSTQKMKVEVYHRKRVTLPKELVFLPIDFMDQSLEDILVSGGFQPGKKSLFLWEGVTMYLTAEVVDKILETIHKLSAKESLVAFDYMGASALKSEDFHFGEKKIGSTAKKARKRQLFGIDEEQIVPFLTSRGFAPLSVLSAAAIDRLYLTAEDGTLFGHASKAHCLALAVVQ